MCPTPTADAHLPDGLILVVEDDPLILEFLCEILQEEGFKVEPHTSADAAKLYLDKHAHEVGLLLTDITMPGEINGAGLANLVGERWPEKPVMVMSGYETPETSGVKHPVAFIKKPWAIGQLLDCVDSAFKSQARGCDVLSAHDCVFDRAFGAFLFDMDGTVLNSIAAAERIWSAWAVRHGVDVETFLPTIHGARAIDTINRLNLPGVDAEAQAAFITQAEIDDVEGIVEIPGAAAFLDSLPKERWAMVTSAPRDLALRRMAAAGIPEPMVMITAEDVQAGKPDPAGYLLAAKRLGLEPRDCLIFEDATVGIQAAEAAGAPLMIITTTHQHPLETRHATLDTYADIRAKVGGDGKLHLQSN